MTDLLSIGTSGLKAYSSALSVVSDNIANSQTEGYARRSIKLSETPSVGDLVLYRNSINPTGVAVDGVNRSVDAWLVEDARISNGESGRTAARLTWVQAGERALGSSDTDVGAMVTTVFNAADQLSANPNDLNLRSAFLQSVGDAATAFRQTGSALQSTAEGIARDASVTVDQLNTDLAALQRVNEGLDRARLDSTNQASLLDERDRLLDRISGVIDVKASFDARGTVTLQTTSGTATTLIANGIVAQLSAIVGTDGRIGFGVVGGGPITPLSGKLAGLTEAASQVADRRGALDQLASQFASNLNAAHVAGVDLQGNPGSPLLDLGTGAATIMALALTPEQVAAGDALSANGTVLGMAGLRGSGSVEAGWNALVSANAQAVASAKAQNAVATTRQESAAAARDNVSEVNLDHEAAELLRFQQAYEGSARVIQVAKETLQSILNIF